MLKPLIYILRKLRFFILGEHTVDEEIRGCVRNINENVRNFNAHEMWAAAFPKEITTEQHEILEHIANKLDELNDLMEEKMIGD